MKAMGRPRPRSWEHPHIDVVFRLLPVGTGRRLELFAECEQSSSSVDCRPGEPAH